MARHAIRKLVPKQKPATNRTETQLPVLRPASPVVGDSEVQQLRGIQRRVRNALRPSQAAQQAHEKRSAIPAAALQRREKKRVVVVVVV